MVWPPGNPRWARWALGTVPGWQLSPTRSPGALASVSWWPKWASDSGLFPGAASGCPHPIRPTRLSKRVSRVPSSPGCRGEGEPISIKRGPEAAPTFAGLWLGSLPSERGCSGGVPAADMPDAGGKLWGEAGGENGSTRRWNPLLQHRQPLHVSSKNGSVLATTQKLKAEPLSLGFRSPRPPPPHRGRLHTRASHVLPRVPSRRCPSRGWPEARCPGQPGQPQ